jgi:hypothetical protein
MCIRYEEFYVLEGEAVEATARWWGQDFISFRQGPIGYPVVTRAVCSLRLNGGPEFVFEAITPILQS